MKYCRTENDWNGFQSFDFFFKCRSSVLIRLLGSLKVYLTLFDNFFQKGNYFSDTRRTFPKKIPFHEKVSPQNIHQ